RPDPLLHRFMPVYDVREHHEIEVEAPAAATYAAARELDLHRSRLVRAIFRRRELLLHSTAHEDVPRPLIRECLALDWAILAEEPGRELVMGAVTRPWEADGRFWSLRPGEFAA